MNFHKEQGMVYIPDELDIEQGLQRTTDLCIAAHQDDIEIMAYHPIAKCYGKKDQWFTGVVVTDGAGSPRSGIYGAYTDEEMQRVRVKEQKTAAVVGDYAAQLLLGYSSREVKENDDRIAEELAGIIALCRPETVYIHNLADKHDTHVATALRSIEAIRLLDSTYRPKKIYGMEVWRGLDWLCDTDKACFDTSTHPNLAAALLGVFDSQIAGGKRYDNAAIGRRLANATFFASHDTDDCDSLSYGIDMTELVNSNGDCEDFIRSYIRRFEEEVVNRLTRLK